MERASAADMAIPESDDGGDAGRAAWEAGDAMGADAGHDHVTEMMRMMQQQNQAILELIRRGPGSTMTSGASVSSSLSRAVDLKGILKCEPYHENH